MVVKYMHHGDDLVEHRAHEASFGALCTNHSANSMFSLIILGISPNAFYFVGRNLSCYDIAIGARGLGFVPWADQIGHSVARDSAPQHAVFLRISKLCYLGAKRRKWVPPLVT